jgi:hypothetical protein
MPTSLRDRLARLTFLCSDIDRLVKDRRRTIPTVTLEEILVESEQLCRVLRRELARRASAARKKPRS